MELSDQTDRQCIQTSTKHFNSGEEKECLPLLALQCHRYDRFYVLNKYLGIRDFRTLYDELNVFLQTFLTKKKSSYRVRLKFLQGVHRTSSGSMSTVSPD